MREARQENGSLGFRLLTTVLLFGLLAEWMLPWLHYGEWADIYQIGPLMTVVGCVMITGLFRPAWYMSLLMNSVLCVMTLMLLFKGDDENAVQWLANYPGMLAGDIKELFAYGMWTMTNELRTLLLFVGWVMLAPALQALVWIRQMALGLTAVTASYLLILHTWVGMDVFDGLLRTSAEGLLLGAVVTIARVKRLHGGTSEYDRQLNPKWVAAGEFLVLLCVGIGMLISSGQPRQTEPSEWTVNAANRLEQAMAELGKADYSAAMQAAVGAAGQGRAVTGYGLDDRELGASIKQDDTVVFSGFSPVQTYWRGESKSVYDGRGWSSSWSGKVLHPVEYGDKLPEITVSTSADSRTIKQTVVMTEPSGSPGLPLFFAGSAGRVVSLSAVDPNRQLSTYVEDELAEALYAADKEAKVERYTVESLLPVTDDAALRSTDSSSSAGETAALNPKADEPDLSEYLQLPDSLPGRVKALADEIAGAGLTSRYDRVKAVEQYLKNSYAYSLDSAVPPKGADFVDDFLFEQQRGYCVHFSSAMVILLREEGIPARWVKGFVSGTPVSTAAGGDVASSTGTLYNVRAKDAHAWVEVYFPGAGWVPFDPTPGFAGGMGPAEADAGSSASGGAASAGGAADDAGAPDHAVAGTDGMLARFEAAVERAASGVARGADALAQAAQSAANGAAAASPAALAAAGAAALLLAAAAAAAAQRRRLRLALSLRRYGMAYAAGRAAAVQEQFAAVSAAAWSLLGRRMMARPPHHTAREYADAVSASMPGARAEALKRFIAWDDAARFGQRADWTAPPPEELAAAMHTLLGKPGKAVPAAAVQAAE
ncbi:DUF3488 and transglutaminase-like domain-containing protein [Paenibacillus glycanilyticus]|uniref:transglutaminase TgpA family protein n=1 Tax=Paenibacillus glycanilyticus TaxID=126569 RepID=UPI00203AB6E2|nr:transglutaminase domain-containing protein [Paenibacillus glycanilyticus]MCM3630896.1 DUF3488 and transglutaminase-like domain-containing protein [Paenibacillus glycanilyticus]